MTTTKDDGRAAPGTPRPSISTLIEQLTDQTKRLVRAEIASAKAELSAKAKHAGLGIGLLGAAAVLSLYGLGFLLHSAMTGLDEVMPLWLAALVVALVLLVVAGVLGMLGAKALKRGMPPKPTRTLKSVKDDVAAVKEGARS